MRALLAGGTWNHTLCKHLLCALLQQWVLYNERTTGLTNQTIALEWLVAHSRQLKERLSTGERMGKCELEKTLL